MKAYSINNFNGDYFDTINRGDVLDLPNLLHPVQFESKQAWTHSTAKGLIFQSYNTLAGFLDFATNTFYEFGKYSPTTSKQITQFCNRVNCARVLV